VLEADALYTRRVAEHLANADLVTDPRRAGARAQLRAMGLTVRSRPARGAVTH